MSSVFLLWFSKTHCSALEMGGEVRVSWCRALLYLSKKDLTINNLIKYLL